MAAMPQWVNDLFASIDEMSSDKFVTFINADGQFKFGNWPAAVGTEQIHGAVSNFFSTIAGLKHNLLGYWESGSEVFVQGEVTYFRKDGTNVTLGFLNLFTMKNGKVQDYLVYADVNPIYVY